MTWRWPWQTREDALITILDSVLRDADTIRTTMGEETSRMIDRNQEKGDNDPEE